MHDFIYINPEDYFKKQGGRDPVTLQELHRRAALEDTCENCSNPVWKLVDLGLCFSCVTGEADASDDYELKAGLGLMKKEIKTATPKFRKAVGVTYLINHWRDGNFYPECAVTAGTVEQALRDAHSKIAELIKINPNLTYCAVRLQVFKVVNK